MNICMRHSVAYTDRCDTCAREEDLVYSAGANAYPPTNPLAPCACPTMYAGAPGQTIDGFCPKHGPYRYTEPLTLA